MAGATAVWAAEQAGKRTLLASTNPVHSLSSLLDQDVFGKHTPVPGVPGLLSWGAPRSIIRSREDFHGDVLGPTPQVAVSQERPAGAFNAAARCRVSASL